VRRSKCLNVCSCPSTEFGNYIGGDLESEDDSDIDIAPSAPSAPGPSTAPAQAPSYAPLEGFDEDEEMEEEEETGMEMTLHGVDGQWSPPASCSRTTCGSALCADADAGQKERQGIRWCCMRTSGIIRLRKRCMARTSRPWSKRKIFSLSRSPSLRPSRYGGLQWRRRGFRPRALIGGECEGCLAARRRT
jgi:hypothetical protein